jgi:predicted AAA+ superfamily ATPase
MAEATVYPRFVLSTVHTALADTPAVVLQGARQVGKSTLLGLVAAGRDSQTFTLDDPPTLAFARDDPAGLINRFPQGMLAVDEAQRAPGLVLPRKASIDADRRPGRFLLTGSADLLHVKGVGDSLAGRAETVEMMPFSQGELARRDVGEDFVAWLLAGATGADFGPLDPQAVVRGGFPEACRRTETRARNWFTSYAARLSDHDARELADGGYADHLSALLTYLAACGQAELVKAALARHLGVAESTAEIYLRLAKTMRLVVEYPAWNRAPHRRLGRRAKASLLDTGLSAALAGFTAAKAVMPGGREYYGALLEQFVALELSKQRAWAREPFTIFHYRDLDGLEVDLLLETSDGTLVAIEVKSTTTPTNKHWKNLATLRSHLPDRDIHGVLLHPGHFTAHLHGWLHVLPITSLWQHA